MLKVQEVIFSHPGHLNQVPYIMAWCYLLMHPPSWLKSLLLSTENKTNILPVLLKQAKESTNGSGTPAVLPPPADPDRDLFPPPYNSLLHREARNFPRVLILPLPPSHLNLLLPCRVPFFSLHPSPNFSFRALVQGSCRWQHLLLPSSTL